MKNVDHSSITSRTAVRSLDPVINDRTVRISEVVVSLQNSKVRKVEVSNVLEIGEIV